MKINSISKKFFVLNLFFFQAIVGCSRYNHQVDHSKMSRQRLISKVPYTLLISDDEPTYSAEAEEAGLGIVLLHGLGMDRDEMEFLKEELYGHYGRNILVINSTAREGNTRNYSIEKQARVVYNEVVSTLTQDGKDSRSFPLFIIGQSQGGNIAIFMEKMYKDKLNLLGVIPLHAPLNGVDLLARGPFDVRQFQDKVAPGLAIIKAQKNRALIWKAITFQLLKLMNYIPFIDRVDHIIGDRTLAGVRGILPNSPCIASIQRYLHSQDQTDSIPGLLFGGFQNDFRKLFSGTIEQYIRDEIEKGKDAHKVNDEVNQAIEALNKHSALFLARDENVLHDTLISLKSQLCRGDSLEDLIDIGDEPYPIDMPGNPNVKCIVLKGITHCTDLSALVYGKGMDGVSGGPVIEQPNTSSAATSRMLPDLFRFIDAQLKNANINLA